MRVLVTGPTNPVGRAVVEALAAAGHEVRAFGVEPGSDPFPGLASVSVFPGRPELGGSIEPVLSECQAVVHCSNLDEPGKDRVAHAVHIERGTLYARYGAERELVNRFIVLMPEAAERTWGKALANAEAHAKATRPSVITEILRVGSPSAAAEKVVAILSRVVNIPTA
jgi:uncharacterized protein YbjT (DUF2867 family)